jgi:hypothetical protein
LGGIADGKWPRKKAIPSPVSDSLSLSGMIWKEKLVAKLAISPVALFHSGTLCTYDARPVSAFLVSSSLDGLK